MLLHLLPDLKPKNMVTIDYKKLTYDELVSIIRESQIELYERGTVTNCKVMFCKINSSKKSKLIKG